MLLIVYGERADTLRALPYIECAGKSSAWRASLQRDWIDGRRRERSGAGTRGTSTRRDPTQMQYLQACDIDVAHRDKKVK